MELTTPEIRRRQIEVATQALEIQRRVVANIDEDLSRATGERVAKLEAEAVRHRANLVEIEERLARWQQQEAI